VPLTAGNERVGLLRRDNAEALRRFPEVFAAGEDKVELVARGDVAAVSRAIDTVIDALVSEGRVPKWRNETFDAAPRWGAPPVFRLDRGAVPFFGTRAYGVHLNGYLRQGGNLWLWVGRRSADKQVAPNKLDNLVAGGIGNGHGVDETLLKEGEEEASIPTSLLRRAAWASAAGRAGIPRRGYRSSPPARLRLSRILSAEAAAPLPVTAARAIISAGLMPLCGIERMVGARSRLEKTAAGRVGHQLMVTIAWRR